MGKKTVYTKITPLPSHVPRQLALDLLHSHTEVIKLNPLVTDVKMIDAPRDAADDEYYSQWYEIYEIITWGFGMKKKFSFKGCFHDQPWGMQSHVYAPMGVDLRNKYRIGGNQPGEPKEPRELGVNTPQEGLYLREDVEITCNVPLTTSFVKKESERALGVMINRLTQKAELLDEGKLHAMFEQGRLKTSKPSQSATFNEKELPSPAVPGIPGSPPASPHPLNSVGLTDRTFSPAVDAQGFGRYHDVARVNSQRRTPAHVPDSQQAGYNGPDYPKNGSEPAGMIGVNELPGSLYPPGMYPPPLQPSTGMSFRSELPGDNTYSSPPPPQAPDSKLAYASYQDGHPYPGSAPSNQTSFPAQSSPQSNQQGFTPSHHTSSPQLSPITRAPQVPWQSTGYQIVNADQASPVHPAHRLSSSNSVEQWQRGLAIDQQTQHSEDPRNSQYSQDSQAGSHHQGPQPPAAAIEPDHQRFSTLSMQPEAPGRHSSHGSRSIECPVCGLFEGDEKAVSHHVSRAHFA